MKSYLQLLVLLMFFCDSCNQPKTNAPEASEKVQSNASSVPAIKESLIADSNVSQKPQTPYTVIYLKGSIYFNEDGVPLAQDKFGWKIIQVKTEDEIYYNLDMYEQELKKLLTGDIKYILKDPSWHRISRDFKTFPSYTQASKFANDSLKVLLSSN